LRDGKADGLRIDHPDGLYDPAQYFERLRSSFMNDVADNAGLAMTALPYVVLEKILTGSELLTADWPVSGTTGYEFGNLVNGLYVDSNAARRMERIYRNFIGDDIDVDDLAYRCKTLIIRSALVSELNVLANQITRIALSKRRTCDFTLNSLRDALAEIVACFPVYRTYVSRAGISATDERYIRTAVIAAKRRSPAADSTVFDFVRDVLLTCIAKGQDAAYRNAVTAFAMKFQQFTSPVMAKGLEDTAFYRFNRLVSLNEVGSDLHRFGTSKTAFHRASENRLGQWPHTMLTTGTHDSKRSEDVRARLNVLSEIPSLWRLRLREWSRLNRTHKRPVNDVLAPSANDEYLLYQTLLGVWPSQPFSHEADRDALRERVENYMLKAIREAKENTSWLNRNEEYEGAVQSFVRALLRPDNPFLANFVPFQKRIARIGYWNSLSQVLLKLTCPGVPDTYQGNELWDFSLVDPDNRRPVDYARRRELFDQIAASGQESTVDLISCLLQGPEDGRIKMHLIWKALCLRQEHPDVFERGGYSPAVVTGAKADHVLAFSRTLGSTTIFIAVPRLIATLMGDNDGPPVGPEVWADTQIVLPEDSGNYWNAFTGEKLINSSAAKRVLASDLFAKFPVALHFSE
jgi:(1->4)-alpha-D-glucan 1-alpha-D-glucosylmutase